MAIFGITENLSKYHLKKKPENDIEFDESTPFIDCGAEKILVDNEKFNKYSKFASYMAIGLAGLLLLQTFRLQIIDRNKFAALAENNRIKERTFRADRGVIYDKNKNVLVKNQAIFDLVATPRELPADESRLNLLIGEIAALTKKSQDEIGGIFKKMNRSSYQSELISENIDISEAIAVETNKDKFPGVEVRNNAIRKYPDAKYFSQVIGYTGRVDANDLKSDDSYESADFIGKEGLEFFYEKELRGEKGSEKVEVNAQGKIIALLNKTGTAAGGNLILSLDGNLQKKLQDALELEMKKARRSDNSQGGAAAVAIDPRNGKILALVSLPTYDNNEFTDPSAKEERSLILNEAGAPMLNRVIGGRYAPGSTIKPVMGIAALSEGIVNENTIIEDKGVISLSGYGGVTNFYGWNRSGLGLMNIISAIAKSSDIFFYTVGGGFGKFIGLGVEKITEYFRKFNLGKKLGIDLPGEKEGFVPTREWKMASEGDEWRRGNTYHLSIGQGYLTVTPLQVASWTEVMANGGTLYKPQLADKITAGDNSDEVIREFQPQIIKSDIADRKFVEIVRRGMREAVLSGSAAALKDLKIPVAGKTGTAQYGLKAEHAHSWFTSFAPYDNPEIVLTILIEGGGEGSSAAVPIAKEILNWYFDKEQTDSSSIAPEANH